ncbi:MAG: hypothetical protein FWH18_08085 [Marinilabiliaceae bacterium]|nr:hypothetical protein [Marinilabiliaceae bacterium]
MYKKVITTAQRMSKRALIAAVAIFIASAIIAQSKQKVAVWVSGYDADISMVVADQLVSAISVSSKYEAVERSADFLKLASKETGYQMSGNVDDSQIVVLGKQLGVKLVCAAKISYVAGTNYVSARIINVETGAIDKAANVNNKFESIDAIIYSCETLASGLLGVKSKSEIAQEQQAIEMRKQEEERKNELKNIENKEKENFLKQEKSRGYTIINSTLYVHTAIAATKVTYKNAVNTCTSSRVGGFSDWRVPSLSEAKRILFTNEEFGGFLIPCGWNTWTSTETKKGYRISFKEYEFNEKQDSFLGVALDCICVRGR